MLQKKLTKIWDVIVDNVFISKVFEKKTNSKYFTGYLDKAIRQLVLVMPKISEYVITFKAQDQDKDKNNKLMSFCRDDEKQLGKYKSIWTKSEDLKNIELNTLPFSDDRYIKTKIKTWPKSLY